jgi:hypothetical protein
MAATRPFDETRPSAALDTACGDRGERKEELVEKFCLEQTADDGGTPFRENDAMTLAVKGGEHFHQVDRRAVSQRDDGRRPSGPRIEMMPGPGPPASSRGRQGRG